MWFGLLLMWGYLISTCVFVVSAHSVVYCFNLVVCSALVGAMIFVLCGSSWYSLLLFLVYVGGVYVLFIFISVNITNITPTTVLDLPAISLCVILSSLFVGVMFVGGGASVLDSSVWLCTPTTGGFYLVLCGVIIFGFGVISSVMSLKIGYFR